MKVRGERECRDCGTHWSYYESGSITCPSCGSVVSVGVDERTRHTDSPATLDLAAARAAAGEDRLDDAAREAAAIAREYVAARGFIDGGDLRDLDPVYVAARELAAGADAVADRLDVEDATERYFLALLRGAPDGERPATSEVPPAGHRPRGLAAAGAVRDYRREVATYLRDAEAPPGARGLLERLTDHVARLEALDGAVDPAEADRLVAAARDIGSYVRTGDETDLESARTRLDALA